MTDGDSSHVPQPDVGSEQATRVVYRRAAEAALRALAVPEGTHDTPWPRPPVSPHAFVPGRSHRAGRPAGGAADWLVSSSTGGESTTTGRLAGLRIAVKDVIDVAGTPTRNGTVGGAWREPDTSATVWRRLADEGALFAGKAATHEMAWGVITPGVANPVDPTRVVGGSSGGSAAAIAAGAADGALGTDTGGSIRIPAALCGVVGIRPTLRTVPGDGVTVLAPSQDVAGPLAHDVGTCGALLEVLQQRTLGGARTGGWKVGIPTDVGPVDETVAAGWQSALRLLDGAGIEIIPVDLPMSWANAVSLLTMLIESAAEHGSAVRADPSGFGSEARALLTLGREFVNVHDDLERSRAQLRTRTAELFGRHELAAVVTPTTACVAPRRRETMVTLAGRRVPVSVALTRFTGLASATGLPAISVPCPSPGLPVGLQVVAPPDAEATCLGLALLLE